MDNDNEGTDRAPGVDSAEKTIPPGDGPPATGDETRPSDDLKALKARLYSEGLQAGRQDVLRRVGMDSLETLQERLAKPAPKPEGGSEGSKLEAEITALKARVNELTPLAERYVSLQERTLSVEIESAAKEAGILPTAVKDVGLLIKDRVRWREDGTLAVFVEGLTGEMVPTGTLKELFSELKETRPHLFSPEISGGAGSGFGVRKNLPGDNSLARKRSVSIREIGQGFLDKS